jgi:hypothetical protein
MPANTSGESAAIRLQLEGRTLECVEAYRARFKKMPSRRAAIKQLIERGLTSLAEPPAASLGTSPLGHEVSAA